MTAARTEYLQQLARRLDSAPRGTASQLIDAATRDLGISVQSVWAAVKPYRVAKPRKRRADAGDSRWPESEVRAVAALYHARPRDQGKRLLTLGDAIDIAIANGMLTERCSESTMARLMQRYGCAARQVDRQSVHTELQSLHPNHVWQVDPSLCVLYRVRGGAYEIADESQFYKNKPDALLRNTEQRIWRYVCTDHTSGAVFCRYYEAHGEDTETLFRFLMEAFGAPTPAKLMHGVPKILLRDPGGANTSHAIRGLLRSLSCAGIDHTPGNARAKGQVECGNNIIERRFESRLAFMRVDSVEALNAAADEWQATFNATEIHSRTGQPRWAVWQTIRREQLRICPPVDLCRLLMRGRPETRVVKGNLTLQFAYPGGESCEYDVAHVPGVSPGMSVAVVPNAYERPGIFVLSEDAEGAEVYHRCVPIARNEFGFRTDAPIIGESYRAPADTPVETSRKQMSEAAWGTSDQREIAKAKRAGAVAFGGKVDPMADLRAVDAPAYMARPGSDLPVDTRIAARDLAAEATTAHLRTSGHAAEVPSAAAPPQAPRLTHIDAALRCRQWLGRALAPDEYRRIESSYPAGVPEDDIPALVAELQRPRLAIVR